MLQDLLISPAVRALFHYFWLPETRLAVIVPGLISVAILVFYACRGKLSRRLQVLWAVAVVVSFVFARWEVTAELEQLYIYSAFSVACVLLLFARVYIAPALAYALTFLGLLGVDVASALWRALEFNRGIDYFYLGVGGAGAYDALVIVPLLTALTVAYGIVRIRSRGERLAEF